ncbi:hypothetical protein ACFQ0I_05030 [Mariniflexile aquimaris]|uniref:DUF4352 domain-containing protein n=1 Tax=Mariniflexile aquimaris TaxID=881009 RepID=A0ABW3BS28_9FLAO
MNRKLITLFFGLITIGISCIYVISEKPILGKWVIGTSRLIGKPINCEIKINGAEFNNAKIFHQTSDFNDKAKRDYLILIIPNKKKTDKHNVLIIDKENDLIRIPNSNKKDYEILGNYLFQSESGANSMIPINDPDKGILFNPKLKIDNETIEFELPEWSEFKVNKVEIKQNAS